MTFLCYVAPKESMQFIEACGILTPQEVRSQIAQGMLPETVLGVSFRNLDCSNFPEHVSLLSESSFACNVAQHICFARTGRFEDPHFMAMGYAINPRIRDFPQFVPEDEVKRLNPDSYPSEVLFKGNIPLELIEDTFAVRTIRRI